jgi:phage terminase large subunit-like protein
LWKEEITKARAIRDGSLDVEGYAPILFEPPAEFTSSLEAASDPAMWAMVNPSLGFSVSDRWLRTSFREAVATGETETRRWLSQHANVEVSAFTAVADAWPGAHVWHVGRDETLSWSRILEGADQVVIGIDGGGMDDLLGVCLLGAFGDTWTAAVHTFINPVVLQRRQSIASLLQDFADAGHLTIMDDTDGLDPLYALIDSVVQVRGYELLIAADPSGVMQEAGRHMTESLGIKRDKLLAVRQGWGLRPGYQALDRRLRAGTFKHAGQPVLDWCVANARVDGGLVTKKISGDAKIDALVSLATASIGMMELPPVADVSTWIF